LCGRGGEEVEEQVLGHEGCGVQRDVVEEDGAVGDAEGVELVRLRGEVGFVDDPLQAVELKSLAN
jgi:hypothetical protein